MRAFFCHSLDWLAIQLARRCPQGGVAKNEDSTELHRLFQQPELFLTPAIADIRFEEEHKLIYDSPLPSPWAQNNIVTGRIHRAQGDWQQQPTVILLHGWNGELNYETLFPWLSRRLTPAGINTISIYLPYHGARKPKGHGAVRDFLCDDLRQVLHATQQSLADIRAVIHWLKANGCPHISVFGLSLGGWLTGLLACHEPLIDAALLGTPIAQMDRALRELPFSRLLKRKLEEHGVSVSALDLTAQTPLLATENILLLSSQFDLFAPPDSLETLWQKWQQPEIWRVPHGHISVLFSPKVMRQVCDWLIQQSRPKVT